MISVNLFSENSKEIEKFLSLFYNAYLDINNALSWEHKYSNPIEVTDIIGVFIDNFDSFNISMWICLDKGVYINVTDKNADYLIKYIFERYPY